MHSFGPTSAHNQLTPHVQFEVSTPHILYACLGGFVVFVCTPFRLLRSACYQVIVTLFPCISQFGMFSLFIREKVCDHIGYYPDLQILTIVVRSSTLAKPVGPFSLALLSVSQLFLSPRYRASCSSLGCQ